MTWLAVLGALRRIPNAVWAALLLAVVLFGAYRWSYARGADAARRECETQRAKELAEAVKHTQKAEQDSADARAELQAYLGRELPKIEEHSHDAIERIRVVYQERPVPVGCGRPEPVRRLLQDRIDQANAAARR